MMMTKEELREMIYKMIVEECENGGVIDKAITKAITRHMLVRHGG